MHCAGFGSYTVITNLALNHVLTLLTLITSGRFSSRQMQNPLPMEALILSQGVPKMLPYADICRSCAAWAG